MKKPLLLILLAQMLMLAACSSSKTAPEVPAPPVKTTGNETKVLIETKLGDIKVILYDFTPQHKANFLKLAKEGFLDGTLFHRVIPGFMIQGGDPDSKKAAAGQQLGMGGTGYFIPAEIGAKHFRGALSAARLPDEANPKKESSGCQFYIVQNGPVPQDQLNQLMQRVQYTPEELDYYLKVGGFPVLDGDYTVFGQVVEGLDVVDKIANAPRDIANNDRPKSDIAMKVKIL